MRPHVKPPLWALAGLAATLFGTIGCQGFGPYGTLWAVPTSSPVTIGSLLDHWNQYNTYYAGVSLENPSAVLFEPKQDGLRVIADKWVPVTDRKSLLTAVRWLEANIDFPPVLWEIRNPQGTLFGYLYSYYGSVEIKELDPQTLLIGDLPLPPADYGPNIEY